MSIPWVAALQIAKKLLPVVVDHAPELLKTIGRIRATSPVPDTVPTDPAITVLQEQINSLQQTIALQADTIGQFQTTLRATQRSLTLAWSLFATTVFLSIMMLAYFVLRA
ncbi:MAG: hypothetical protein H8K09_06910 [Nitrospira sp.]|nr:hypothetical protein [Nitrospira sp.]